MSAFIPVSFHVNDPFNRNCKKQPLMTVLAATWMSMVKNEGSNSTLRRGRIMSSGSWTITDIEGVQSKIGIRQLEIQKWGGEFTGAGGKLIFFLFQLIIP
jgi:hypothetical protein